jgi:methylthioribose-1-phosphate isomerase
MRAIDWVAGPRIGHIRLIDQTRLPGSLVELEIHTVDQLVDAIRRLAVRGAPALGVAGAMGVALAVGTMPESSARQAIERLRVARPTAVNLAAAVDRTLEAFRAGGPGDALATALRMRDDDIAACRSMARRGVELLGELCPGRARLTMMTICNTGMLAAVEHGTALGVVEQLHVEGRLDRALVCETRPLLQGARLTAWELDRMGAPFDVLVDSAAASTLARGGVDAVVVGADRIAANGDVANKVGTYPLAALAARHGLPFYVAAPVSTIDPRTPTGEEIPIEERDPAEVVSGAEAFNPAFDITPAELVTAVFTEAGVLEPPYEESIARVAAG